MKAYNTAFLRNIGIVGHGDTGKTQLVSSLLFTAGMTPRLGKVIITPVRTLRLVE